MAIVSDVFTNTFTASNREFYHRYSGLALPRHTSYPAANFWQTANDGDSIKGDLANLSYSRAQGPRHKTSWYVHVPFCDKLCHYCGCNKFVIGKDHKDSAAFRNKYFLGIEAELLQLGHGQTWLCDQLHLGGGTPTWLSPNDLQKLFQMLSDRLVFSSQAELSVEVDPRVTTRDHLKMLRSLGFNRISLGIQDFDASVQESISRLQPFTMVEKFFEECRSLGFTSINFDLIYGLPRQTRNSLEDTIEKVLKLMPDRIAYYRLALLPDIFKWQRTFRAEDIPDNESVLDFMLMAIHKFEENGYTYIGLDHFARNDEPLAQAYRNKTLRRSFQGMTTHDALPVIGIGPSAISVLENVYAQNQVQFSKWYDAVQNGSQLAKIHRMSLSDHKCKYVINQLYCYRSVSKTAFAREFGESFDQFYEDRLIAMSQLAREGFIEDTPEEIRVIGLVGPLLLRVVAAVFDRYLSPDAWKHGMTQGHASRVG